MRPRISSNAGAILKRMQARKDAVRRELSTVAVRIKFVLVGESKKILSEKIYSVPIPTVTRRKEKVAEHPQFSLDTRRQVGHRFEDRKRPKKEKAWKRTGHLLNREGGRTEGPNVIFYNSANYAAYRYTLGTEEGRQIQSPGVKSVQWQAEALQKMREFILQERRKGVLKALSGGAV